jgi:hypothetical protein
MLGHPSLVSGVMLGHLNSFRSNAGSSASSVRSNAGSSTSSVRSNAGSSASLAGSNAWVGSSDEGLNVHARASVSKIKSNNESPLYFNRVISLASQTSRSKEVIWHSDSVYCIVGLKGCWHNLTVILSIE